MIENIITYAFISVGFIVLLGYIPTVLTMLKSKTSDTDVRGWALWTICGLISCLYFSIVQKDLIAALIQGGHLIGCATVLTIQLGKKSKSNSEES